MFVAITDRFYMRFLVWVALVALIPVCVFADDGQHRFYHLELGLQTGVSYYAGELAPHAFMSVGEVYGAQARIKIDPRWAVQVKGQRQRVVNYVHEGNEWGIIQGKYQVPMWHVDVMGEYNFFQLGLDEYNVQMKPVTPFLTVGVGMTVFNSFATNKENVYPRLAKGANKDFALYVPVGIGLKWKFAERWQFQLAWQHNLYMLNGDGLEGVITSVKSDDKKQDIQLNDSYGMNGGNVMNNDVTSTITAGIVFEFGRKRKTCVFCLFDR